MRSRWGWIPRSLYPLATIRNGVPRRSAGRFYRLGVERLEDRHLLNAGPLSIVGDAALSLLPPLNTDSSDKRLSHGSDEKHGNQEALESKSQKIDREDALSAAVGSNTSQSNGSDHSDNGLHLGQLKHQITEVISGASPLDISSDIEQSSGSDKSNNGLHLGQIKNQSDVVNNLVTNPVSSSNISSDNGSSVGSDHSDDSLSPGQAVGRPTPTGNVVSPSTLSADLQSSPGPNPAADDDSSYLDMSVSQTTAMGNAVVSRKVSVQVMGPNSPQVSVTVSVTVEQEEGSESYAPGNLLIIPTSSTPPPRLAMGPTVLLELYEPTVQNAPQESHSAATSADANKSRTDRGMTTPDLSGLAMMAAKVEARETQSTAEESHAAMPTAAAVVSNSAAPVAAHGGPHEIELVAIAAIDAVGSHFFVPAVVKDDIDPGVHVAADVVPVDHGEALLNVQEPAPAEEVALAETSLPQVVTTQASLLDSLPVDFRAVDQALNELLSEIEALGGNLTAWLDVTTMPPWAMAAGVAAATGVGGLYIRRTRLRRARQQQLDEESTSWLFTQSHGFATGSTL